MGEEMYLIEEGEITLERMRNLGPGHSSPFHPGPLDQGKYLVPTHEHMFMCALART